MDINALRIRDLGCQPYTEVWQAMSQFTDKRDDSTIDEVWFVEHPPVYTQGRAGKAEHILRALDVPLVQSDRGGQITYHAPGQLVFYPLINLRRRGLGVRDMVTLLEQLVIQWLASYQIDAYAKADAPGVYINIDQKDAKISSLGLRIRHGCSFHGVSINIDMDLTPFEYINPCGHEGLAMTQLANLCDPPVPDIKVIQQQLAQALADQLDVSDICQVDE